MVDLVTFRDWTVDVFPYQPVDVTAGLVRGTIPYPHSAIRKGHLNRSFFYINLCLYDDAHFATFFLKDVDIVFHPCNNTSTLGNKHDPETPNTIPDGADSPDGT